MNSHLHHVLRLRVGGAILTCFCVVHRDEVIVQYYIRDSVLCFYLI